MFPLSHIGMLGKGLPFQDGTQLSAQDEGIAAMAGGGKRPRRVAGPGQPSGSVSSSPLEMPPSAPDMPEADPIGNGSDVSFDAAKNMRMGMDVAAFPRSRPMGMPVEAPIDRRATMDIDLTEPQVGAAPLPPTVRNPRLVAMERELGNMADPRAIAAAQMKNRGLGAKIAGGAMGALQALGGRGGIIGGVMSGVRGDDQRNGIMQQVSAQNAAKRQQILDQYAIEKEIGQQQQEQGDQDIRIAGLARENRSLDESIRARRSTEAQKRAQDDWDREKFNRQDSTTRRGQDVSTENNKRTTAPNPKDRIMSGGYGDDGRATYLEVQEDGSVVSKAAPGAVRYQRPPSRGGSSRGGASDKVQKNRDDAQARKDAEDQAYADQYQFESERLKEQMLQAGKDPDNDEYDAQEFKLKLDQIMKSGSIKAVTRARRDSNRADWSLD